MKKTIGNLTVRIGADTKQFTNAMRKTHRQTNMMSKQFSQLGNMMAGAFSVYAAGSIIKGAIKTNADFEASLSSLSAITGMVGKDLEFFATQSKKTSLKTQQSAAGMLKAYERVGSIRPELLRTKEALVEVTNAAVILSESTGGKLSIEDAANAATGVMNQMDIATKDAVKTVNILAAGSKYGSSTTVDLAEAFKGFGAVAKDSNLTLEQSVALVELAASKMILGAEAGTAIKGVLLRLKAAGLGYASGQFVLNDAIDEFNVNLNNLGTQLEKDAYKEEVFTKKGIVMGTILVKNKDMFNDLTGAVTGTNTALDQAAIQSDNLAGAWKRLGNAWDSIFTGEGGLSKTLKGAVDLATDFVKVLQGSTVNNKLFESSPVLWMTRFKQVVFDGEDLFKNDQYNPKKTAEDFRNAASSVGVFNQEIEKTVSIWEQLGSEVVGPAVAGVHTWGKSLGELQTKIDDNNKALQETKDIDIAKQLMLENEQLERQIRDRKILLGLIETHGRQELSRLTPVSGQVTPSAGLTGSFLSPNSVKMMHAMTNAVSGLALAMSKLGTVAIDMNMIVTSAVQNMAMAISNAFSDAISGTDTFMGSFFKGMIAVITQFMRAMGQAMIAAGMASEIFQTLLLTNPFAAIAAGFALQAAAGIVEGIMREPVALAQGGLAFGPTMAMVGDNAGARTDPEVISPLSKLQGMMGGSEVNVTGQFRIRGTDLVVLLDRATDYKNQYS